MGPTPRPMAVARTTPALPGNATGRPASRRPRVQAVVVCRRAGAARNLAAADIACGRAGTARKPAAVVACGRAGAARNLAAADIASGRAGAVRKPAVARAPRAVSPSRRLAVSVCALPFALALACAAPVRAQAQALNTLTRREKREGWKLLFDGHTTRGWRGYRRADLPAGWQVRHGALTRIDAAGDIVTTSKYESFDLVFDWKIAHGGNSGVMYHVTEDVPEPYGSGPEYQLLDDPNFADGKSLLTSAGACYGLYAIPEHLARPAGQWNHSRLLVQHGHVDHWLNGVLAARYLIGSPDWNARVARSKFKEWPRFGKAPTGFIDLQDHQFVVAFRNMKIRVLP